MLKATGYLDFGSERPAVWPGETFECDEKTAGQLIRAGVAVRIEQELPASVASESVLVVEDEPLVTPEILDPRIESEPPKKKSRKRSEA